LSCEENSLPQFSILTTHHSPLTTHYFHIKILNWKIFSTYPSTKKEFELKITFLVYLGGAD